MATAVNVRLIVFIQEVKSHSLKGVIADGNHLCLMEYQTTWRIQDEANFSGVRHPISRRDCQLYKGYECRHSCHNGSYLKIFWHRCSCSDWQGTWSGLGGCCLF